MNYLCIESHEHALEALSHASHTHSLSMLNQLLISSASYQFIKAEDDMPYWVMYNLSMATYITCHMHIQEMPDYFSKIVSLLHCTKMMIYVLLQLIVPMPSLTSSLIAWVPAIYHVLLKPLCMDILLRFNLIYFKISSLISFNCHSVAKPVANISHMSMQSILIMHSKLSRGRNIQVGIDKEYIWLPVSEKTTLQ